MKAVILVYQMKEICDVLKISLELIYYKTLGIHPALKICQHFALGKGFNNIKLLT